MKLELHLGSKILRPAYFNAVAAVKIFNNSGFQVVALPIESGLGVLVASAGARTL